MTKYDWSAHYDDEGRIFYYNEKLDESRWDPPAEGFNPPPSKWAAYKDDEGNTYYYNQETGETQWEKPDNFQEEGALDQAQSASADESATQKEAAENQAGQAPEIDTSDSIHPETGDTVDTATHESKSTRDDQEMASSPSPETEIDPETLKLQKAEQAISQPDSILEHDAIENVILVSQAHGTPQQTIATVVDALACQPAICGLISKWLFTTMGTSPDDVRKLAEDVIISFAKESFTREAGDRITELRKSQTQFLSSMMESSRWRKLLIDLSATHRDSAILKFCLGEISKGGHHREIANRINQSEHFEVFNAMLTSELKSIVKLAVAAGTETSSTSIIEVVENLEKACTGSAYTYFYTQNMITVLLERVEALGNEPRIQRVVRKLQHLRMRLEAYMIDPDASKASSDDSMFRKRRLEVTLSVSDLRQKKSRVSSSNHGSNQTSELEKSLIYFVKRYAAGIKIDVSVLDPLLPQGLSSDGSVIGSLLIENPPTVKALLAQLFRAGSFRASSHSVRSKCARLLAFATLASTVSSSREQVNYEEKSLTGLILEASDLCKLVEAKTSFLVVSDSTRGPTKSPGEKLCSLCTHYPVIAQGVLLWAKDFSSSPDFSSLATFTTISSSILSLVRITAIAQPFSRAEALAICATFLRVPKSSDYKKIESIIQQSLRLMIFLLLHGDAIVVLNAFKKRVEDKRSSSLDASLIRYFLSAILKVVQVPVSLPFARALQSLVETKECLDAVRASYFDADRDALVEILEFPILEKIATGEEKRKFQSLIDAMRLQKS